MNLSRREFLKTAGLGAGLAVTSALMPLSRCGSAQKTPNIVLIFTDDQGYHDLGCYGATDFETPNIDKIAAEGMRFTQFYVSQAVCSASRASLLTGCYAERISILGALSPNASIGLNPEEETIAEILKRRNYTAGIFGKWHLGHHEKFLPLQQGFDEYLGLPYSNDMWPVDYDGKPMAGKGKKSQYPILPLIRNNEKIAEIISLEDQNTLTTRYTEAAVKFIEKHKNRPFFLYIPHSMPHVPLGVSEKYRGKSKQGKYGDVIEEIDWSVGEITKALKKFHLEDNTLVIFASDNGPWKNFGNHAGSTGPLREGKGTAFEGGARVPCIMKWPEHIPAGSVCDEITASIDILPTIASICGTDLPEKPIDGMDLSQLVLGKKGRSPRDHYFYYYESELRGVRKGDWKLQFSHRSRSYAGVDPGKDGLPGPYNHVYFEKALYNLREDIGEEHSRLAEFPAIAADLEALAETARYKYGDQLTGALGREIREPGRIGPLHNERVDHLAKGKPVNLKNPCHPKYRGGSNNALTDGILGTFDFNDGSWQGFEYENLEATIDLGELKQVSSLRCGFLEDQGSWIFRPKKVIFSVSDNGSDFHDIYNVTHHTVQTHGQDIWNVTVEMKPQMVRYIRMTAENQKTVPDWHIGASGRAWIFADEIVVD